MANRRKLLEQMAARINPDQYKGHIEERLQDRLETSSRLVLIIQQLEADPNASEVGVAQLDTLYQQLESLNWQIGDLEERLGGLDKAHVESIVGSRAERRRTEKAAGKAPKKGVPLDTDAGAEPTPESDDEPLEDLDEGNQESAEEGG